MPEGAAQAVPSNAEPACIPPSPSFQTGELLALQLPAPPEPNTCRCGRGSHPARFTHTGWYFRTSPSPPARPLRREQRQPSLVTLTPKPRPPPSSRNKEHLARTCLPAGRAAPVLHRRLPCSSFWDVFAAPQRCLLVARWLLGGHRSLGVAPREVGVSGSLSRCSGEVSSSERVWWLCWKLSRV